MTKTFRKQLASPRQDFFGLVFTGVIQIKTAGEYTFIARSDDGSVIMIGGHAVTEHDGRHGGDERNGKVRLEVGHYPFEVLFFEHDDGEDIDVFYEGPGFKRRRIPGDVLFHEAE